MELWLLGAGAIVLVGITLWIVWPARTANGHGNPTQGKEVMDNPMSDNNERPGVSPPVEKAGDQYTNATADAVSGGVAAAARLATETTQSTSATTEGAQLPTTPSFPSTSWTPPAESSSGRSRPKTIGLGAGVVLAAAGAVGGAWAYARWQRERNKPINRFRRGARDMGSRLGERVPYVDELHPAVPPVSGAAVALLLTGLVASRILRNSSGGATELASDTARWALARRFDAVKQGRKVAGRGSEVVDSGRGLTAYLSTDQLAALVEASRSSGKRLGIITAAVVGVGSFLIWRLTHQAEPAQS